MSTPTRAWLACLAVVAALVVVVPAFTGGSRPARPLSEPVEHESAGFDSDAELVSELDRALATVRGSVGRGPTASGAIARELPPHGRERRRERPERAQPVTLEAFVAGALLRGIYYGESTRAAVLNDELVQAGDELAPGLCVSAIGERHVLLELGGRTARLDLSAATLAGLSPAEPRGGEALR